MRTRERSRGLAILEVDALGDTDERGEALDTGTGTDDIDRQIADARLGIGRIVIIVHPADERAQIGRLRAILGNSDVLNRVALTIVDAEEVIGCGAIVTNASPLNTSHIDVVGLRKVRTSVRFRRSNIGLELLQVLNLADDVRILNGTRTTTELLGRLFCGAECF